jgi:arsenate reductase-like glutaredoxin family protein
LHPGCGTSRNTLSLIRQAGIEPRVIEYLKTPPTRAELVDLIGRMGVSVRDVLRDKGRAPGPDQPADRGHSARREALTSLRNGARHPAGITADQEAWPIRE